MPVAADDRVLLLCGTRGIPVHGPSGASAHLRGVARALRRSGATVRVATPLLQDHRGRWDSPLGVPVVTHPPRHWPRPLRHAGEVWDARALVERATRSFEPDSIWERHTLVCDAGARLARRLDIPRVVEVNAPLVLERQRYDPLRDPGAARQREVDDLQQADRVVVVSEWLAQWAVSEGGVEPDRVRHVPNGVEPRPPGDRAAARQHLGVGQRRLVGFVGSHKPWHGTERLPAILDALGSDTIGLMVGTGPADVPRHPRLRHVPQVGPHALTHLIAAMDVGLAPYPADAPPWFCPLKVLQYRAQGVPVVGSDVGDTALLMADGGVVPSSDDPGDWAEAIEVAAALPRTPWLRTWDDVVREATAR